MQKRLQRNAVDDSVVYKTINIFRPDHEIFFFSDVPHLIKTCRNCLFNLGKGRFSRYMWNNGKYLLWQHIVQVYKHDLRQWVTHASKVVVRSLGKISCSVLSDSVAVALRQVMADAASETSKLCEMMNKFFDCMNVRSINEQNTKQAKHQTLHNCQ